MVTKAQKVRLGVFLFISIGLLILFLLIIAGTRLLERLDTYYIAYEDVSVSGLQVGAQVKYHGIRVGRVETIRIDPEDVNRVIVEVRVEKGTPIKTDTEASLILVGITGLKQVELFGGTTEAKLLEPGGYIRAGTTFFDDISISVEEITAKLDRVLGNIDSLTSVANQVKFSNMLTNLEVITQTTMRAVETLDSTINSREFESIISNAAIFTEDLAQADITGIVRELNEAITNANQAFTHIDLMVIRSRRDILLTFETLKEAADNFEEFTRLLSEDPSLILRRRN
ncbi:MAG: MCE family protein [Candidatus Cloacimonetes bacterium]|nr:MCE family protein [Candidatus Cloacimonadota bacterium]